MGRQTFGERFCQRSQKAYRVPDNAEMGEIEDRSIFVGIDRENVIRALDADAMLNRAGNSRCDIEFRTDRLAGLADLAIRADPALLHQGAGTAVFGPEDASELANKLEIFRG